MARPVQDVRIWSLQDRRKHAMAKRPWLVRWVVDGREHNRSYRTRAEADRYRSQLLVAQSKAERFDHDSGEPVSWTPVTGDKQLVAWVRQWLAEQWPEWQPRTRASAVEALARFVPLVCSASAPEPPAEMRAYLVQSLRPGAEVDGAHPCERWLARWSPALGHLDREMMANVEQQLAIGASGQPLSANVSNRYRTTAHACIKRAVELDVLAADPWPPPPSGRRRRKSARKRRSVDIRLLPDPATMEAAIAAMRSHQPGSRTYEVMTAVAYYAGLRPSEVVALRPRSLDLPEEGWGRIEVVEADVDWDEPGEPKTGQRSVPIPPQLVAILRSWIEDVGVGDDNLLFRTRGNKRPTQSNWGRALKRGLAAVEHDPIRVYDCRHAAATTWLRAGVPLGEVARRLGHSVETLVSTYVGALEGDEAIANDRIEQALSPTAERSASAGSQRRRQARSSSFYVA